MNFKDVLIIGAGISGCAVALALAKKGIPVTIMTSASDQRTYHSSFIKMESLEDKLKYLKNISNRIGCSRATEQVVSLAKKSVDEFLESHFLVDRYGNIDIHRCLQEQLKQFPHVEWISQHNAIELLTLESHSTRKADLYKKAACLGALVYNHETHQVEQFLAKETILATGGVASLFLYSTHPLTTKGDGLAMASRAGARLFNIEQIQFHPLALFSKDKPCVPLPIELLNIGGKLQNLKHMTLEDVSLDGHLAEQLYLELFKNRVDHLWLDLTLFDPVALKEQFPDVDACCLNYGFNLARDLIPIVPAAQYTCGGVGVDRVGQTNVHRLRAVGEVSCTGLFYDFRDEAMSVLESLTWAKACAEDVAKHLTKFVYYFPELKEWRQPISVFSSVVHEDWALLRQLMWHYIGIIRDPQRLKRGYSLLHKLKVHNEVEGEENFSIERLSLLNALQTALLITQSALELIKDTKYPVYTQPLPLSIPMLV